MGGVTLDRKAAKEPEMGRPAGAPSEPGSSRPLSPRELRLVLTVLSAGLLLRLVIAGVSKGTNDIVSWEGFAAQIAEHGVIWMYGHVPLWNHPPLMGYLVDSLRDLSDTIDWRFAPVFKLVPIAADWVSAVLVFAVWRRRSGEFRPALRALVVFSFSLNAMLVSGYHGNTDSLVGALILAACFATERGSYLVAGLLAGGAVNVKLIPVLLFPLLVANAAPREVLRFSLGALVGALPFLPILAVDSAGFVRNAVAYRSNFDNWGIPLLVRTPWYLAREHGYLGIREALDRVREGYILLGTYLVIGSVLATAAFSRFRRPLSVYTRVALGLALFFVLAPGFGVQYTTILGPVLIAASWRWGLAWAIGSGIFVGSVYASFWTGGYPIHSLFYGPFRVPSAALGILCWGFLVVFVANTFPGLPVLGPLAGRLVARVRARVPA